MMMITSPTIQTFFNRSTRTHPSRKNTMIASTSIWAAPLSAYTLFAFLLLDVYWFDLLTLCQLVFYNASHFLPIVLTHVIPGKHNVQYRARFWTTAPFSLLGLPRWFQIVYYQKQSHRADRLDMFVYLCRALVIVIVLQICF